MHGDRRGAASAALILAAAAGMVMPQAGAAPASTGAESIDLPSARAVAMPNDASSLFAACRAACIDGRADEADRLLLDAVKSGFNDFSRLQRDRSLDAIRERTVYRAILAARDAADPALSRRTIRNWQDRLGDDRYAVLPDDLRRLPMLSALPAARRSQVRMRIERLVDHLGHTIFPSGLRHTVLVVLPAPEEAAAVFDHPNIQGVYRHSSRTIISLDSGRSLRHEIVHAMHHADMDARGQGHAAWILEGLAGLYERYDLDARGRATFEPNDRDDITRRLAASDQLIDWRTLLEMRPDELEADAARTYAQARSIMRFIAAHHDLDGWYEAYVTDYDLDETGRLAIEAAFRAPLPEIERDWRAWIMRIPSAATVTALGRDSQDVAPEDADEVAEAPTVLPAPPKLSRALHVAAREAYDGGEFDRASRLLRRVVQQQPTAARARYELGLASVRLGDLPAAHRQQVALESLDPSLASLLGNLLRVGRDDARPELTPSMR